MNVWSMLPLSPLKPQHGQTTWYHDRTIGAKYSSIKLVMHFVVEHFVVEYFVLEQRRSLPGIAEIFFFTTMHGKSKKGVVATSYLWALGTLVSSLRKSVTHLFNRWPTMEACCKTCLPLRKPVPISARALGVCRNTKQNYVCGWRGMNWMELSLEVLHLPIHGGCLYLGKC